MGLYTLQNGPCNGREIEVDEFYENGWRVPPFIRVIVDQYRPIHSPYATPIPQDDVMQIAVYRAVIYTSGPLDQRNILYQYEYHSG
jgi:hypothetical protein